MSKDSERAQQTPQGLTPFPELRTDDREKRYKTHEQDVKHSAQYFQASQRANPNPKIFGKGSVKTMGELRQSSVKMRIARLRRASWQKRRENS